MNCLGCGRVFPEKFFGEVEPGGNMLCLECGHVMCWTDDLALREMTESERIEAGSNFELMQARNKILPWNGPKYWYSSWALASLLSLLIVMVILERLKIVEVLHHAR